MSRVANSKFLSLSMVSSCSKEEPAYPFRRGGTRRISIWIYVVKKTRKQEAVSRKQKRAPPSAPPRGDERRPRRGGVGRGWGSSVSCFPFPVSYDNRRMRRAIALSWAMVASPPWVKNQARRTTQNPSRTTIAVTLIL